MPTDQSSLERAIAEIQLQKDAVRIAETGVRKLRSLNQIDVDQADAFLERLHSRFTALDNKQNTLADTGAVAVAPSAEQLASLRARVDALRDRNVTQASIEGIVGAAFALAAAIEPAGAASAAASAPAATEGPNPAPPARISGAWIGAAAVVVLAALAVTIGNSRRK